DESLRGLRKRHPLAFIDPPEIRRLFAGPFDPRRVLRLEIAVRRERRRVGVRLEYAARVRRADDHALVDFEGHGEELAARFFLQNIVVRLYAAEGVLAHPRPTLCIAP